MSDTMFDRLEARENFRGQRGSIRPNIDRLVVTKIFIRILVVPIVYGSFFYTHGHLNSLNRSFALGLRALTRGRPT